MKPIIFRTCDNRECKGYEKEVELTEAEKESFYISPFCTTCHNQGRLRIVHKEITAETIEAFYAKVNGMAKEFHLLKKLVSKGVAESEDQRRYGEILEQIQDLECTGCGQKLIAHEHT